MLTKKNYTVLQLTASTFFIPSFYAAYNCLYIGSLIYFLNGLVSLYVHRLNRFKKDDFFDFLDHIFVGCWVSYNGYLIYYCVNKLTPLTYALIALYLKLQTKKYNWRCHKRNMIHGAMHISGCIGSMYVIKEKLNQNE